IHGAPLPKTPACRLASRKRRYASTTSRANTERDAAADLATSEGGGGRPKGDLRLPPASGGLVLAGRFKPQAANSLCIRRRWWIVIEHRADQLGLDGGGDDPLHEDLHRHVAVIRLDPEGLPQRVLDPAMNDPLAPGQLHPSARHHARVSHQPDAAALAQGED